MNYTQQYDTNPESSELYLFFITLSEKGNYEGVQRETVVPGDPSFLHDRNLIHLRSHYVNLHLLAPLYTLLLGTSFSPYSTYKTDGKVGPETEDVDETRGPPTGWETEDQTQHDVPP